MYRNIDISFWTDPKVDDDFTPEDKYFYLYLLTNPHTHLCGCYEISLKQMERETGYNQDTVHRLLKRMEREHQVIRFSEANKEILLLNWYKYNWTKSQKLLSSIRSGLKAIKTDAFREYISDVLENFGYGMDRVSIPYPTVTVSEQYQNQYTEQHQNSDSAQSCSAACEPSARARTVVDYQAIVDDYNTTCTKLPACKKLSETRKRAIKARLNTYSAEELHKVFVAAQNSSWHTGENDRNWRADFDWLMTDRNAAKMLERYERDGGGTKLDDWEKDWLAEYRAMIRGQEQEEQNEQKAAAGEA